MNKSKQFCPLRFRHGFTFVELMVGIIVTSIVLGAMAVFTFGVGQGWTQTASAQSVFLAGSLATDRIQHVIRAAKLIDGNANSPTACMFWQNDDNGDGKIQFSELALLQYEPATQAIYEYTVQQTAPDRTISPPALMTAADFTATPLYLQKTALAHNVTACQFIPIAADSTTQRPSLQFVLTISDGNTSTVLYGAATLRCPNNEPE